MLESEKRTEPYLKKQIEKQRGLCLKFVSPGYTGVPDRICILNGHVFFVETKSQGKKLSPRQRFVKSLFESLEISVYKADTKKEVDEILAKELSRIRN